MVGDPVGGHVMRPPSGLTWSQVPEQSVHVGSSVKEFAHMEVPSLPSLHPVVFIGSATTEHARQLFW